MFIFIFIEDNSPGVNSTYFNLNKSKQITKAKCYRENYAVKRVKLVLWIWSLLFQLLRKITAIRPLLLNVLP